jgi:hypothetical protein
MPTIVPQLWQKIDAVCHSCHSWQQCNERMITAMALLTIIITVSLVLAASYGLLYLVSFVSKDGYGRRDAFRNPPRSHRPDVFDPHLHQGGRA